MIAHFNNIGKDWRSKAEGRKCADRMCNDCVGQPGSWSWLSSVFFLLHLRESLYEENIFSGNSAQWLLLFENVKTSLFCLYFRCGIK